MKYVCALCAFLWLSDFSFVAQAQTPLQEMVKTEQAFSKMAEEKDTRDAFMAYIADLPIGGDVSRAGDLGYTHGTYEITDAKKVVERGSYVRIWKVEDGAWRVVLDVTNAH